MLTVRAIVGAGWRPSIMLCRKARPGSAVSTSLDTMPKMRSLGKPSRAARSGLAGAEAGMMLSYV
jgi:hypothetical protein